MEYYTIISSKKYSLHRRTILKKSRCIHIDFYHLYICRVFYVLKQFFLIHWAITNTLNERSKCRALKSCYNKTMHWITQVKGYWLNHIICYCLWLIGILYKRCENTGFDCRIVDSIFIRENTGQWKPVFSHVLGSDIFGHCSYSRLLLICLHLYLAKKLWKM